MGGHFEESSHPKGWELTAEGSLGTQESLYRQSRQIARPQRNGSLGKVHEHVASFLPGEVEKAGGSATEKGQRWAWPWVGIRLQLLCLGVQAQGVSLLQSPRGIRAD